MNVEHHATDMVPNDCIWVCCCIVQQMDNGFGGCFGGIGLGGSDGAEGNEHSGVHRKAVIQEVTNDSLNSGDGAGRKFVGGVVGVCVLYFRSICWLIPCMGGVFRFGGCRMFEFL